MLAVFGADDHGQTGMHGAALGDMVSDRVTQLGLLVICVQELSVGPAALARLPVGIQGAADQQAVRRIPENQAVRRSRPIARALGVDWPYWSR